MARKVKRLNVQMPEEVYNWIQSRSEQSGMPMAAVVLSCIDRARKEEQVMQMIQGPGLPAFMALLREQNSQEQPKETNEAGTGA